MYAVDALPATYLEARNSEIEAARKAAQRLAAAKAANAQSCMQAAGNNNTNNNNNGSAHNSAANTPLPSPGVNSHSGFLGFFSALSKKSEGCGVPSTSVFGSPTWTPCPSPQLQKSEEKK